MRGFVLAQLRRGGGRLVAAGIAIALGSAFVAAALLGSQIVKTTAYNAVSAGYANADLLLETTQWETGLTSAQLAAAADVDGVEAVSPIYQLSFIVSKDAASDYVWARSAASDPRLESADLDSGRLPADASEITLGIASAKRLGVQLGDEVVAATFADTGFVEADDGLTEPLAAPYQATVEVVGLLAEPAGFNFDAPTAMVVHELALNIAANGPVEHTTDSSELTADRALVLLEPGADIHTVRAELDAMRPDQLFTASTVEEVAHETVRMFSGDADILTAFVLAFAGIALVVAAIVISNTFQVLVAQRAQLLALLRCVGATRRQVRGSVMLEASVVGLVASAVGLGIGILLAQAALWIVPTLDLAVPVPSTVALTPAVVVWPLATGTLVTVLAALAPARIATRVAPLAALRPIELVPVRKIGRTRLALALVAAVGGGLALAAVTWLAVATELSDPTALVALGILAGAVSFTGILVGAVYFVPGVARLLGRVAARLGGVPGKIAAANSVRNPRRTTATASALLIGATLVTMMATGAATARDSLATLMDDSYPVDVAVRGAWSDMTAPTLTAAQQAAVEQADGVAKAVPVRGKLADVTAPDGGVWSGSVITTAPATELAAVMRNGASNVPEVGTTAAPVWFDVEDGGTLQLTAEGTTIELTNDPSAMGQLWLAEEDFDALPGPAEVTAMWVSLEPGVDAREFTVTLRDTFTELSATLGDAPPEVSGAAVERAGYEQVIDTLLAILVGLLGVAVIIALVGVANTLSLSVLERRRESATLRAIGLRRAQLREMLAVEGVLIALVGAVLGVVLGLGYGWLGSALLLGSSGGLTLAVPWRDLGLILAIAVAAGLLASVLPSRTATRTPPVAALAVD